VLLDGRDIKNLNVKWLRRQIGMFSREGQRVLTTGLVSQEPTLFDTTVRGNIEHGLIGSAFEHLSPAERFERVKTACISANAHDFISALPQGYDTPVGARGMLLSGGQKQRVAIARAIVSDCKILCLDEATSALDAQSEGVVQDALDKARKGRTTIVVAHRLATVKDCDKIVVMGPEGKILDVGTHDQLVERRGVYWELVEAQRLKEVDDAAIQKARDAIEVSRERQGAHEAETIEDEKNVDIEDEQRGEVLKETTPGLFRIGRRLLSINRADAHLYVLGVTGAIAHGMAYPACAILFGLALEDFQIQDMWEMREALKWKA
jgi:ATP-binding cassette subfamily B (MDR/TAP) protein 1